MAPSIKCMSIYCACKHLDTHSILLRDQASKARQIHKEGASRGFVARRCGVASSFLFLLRLLP